MDSRGWNHANSLGLLVEAEGIVSLNRVSASWDAARVSRQFTRGERRNCPQEQDHPWAQDGLEIKGLAFATNWLRSAALGIPTHQSPEKETSGVSWEKLQI